MKNNLQKNFTEELIINKYLKKLNFNKRGTYNFENDASYINLKKNKKLIITTDSISEDLDFFKNDNPKSIATKIITINLSDLSAMGAKPYAYSLSLFLPNYIDKKWIKFFTNELFKIQKKHNFFLLGGDLSKSNKLSITSTFFGTSNTNILASQNSINLYDDIWITGNLGDSYVGLQILNNKIKIKNDIIRKFFLKKYYYPNPCLLGPKLTKYINAIKDNSDGFIGDLNKMLNNKYGAKLNLSNLPFSSFLNNLLNKKKIKKKYIINSGDNYQLIIISNKKFRNKIIHIAKKNYVKITRVGKVTENNKIVDDSNNLLNIPKKYDHFC